MNNTKNCVFDEIWQELYETLPIFCTRADVARTGLVSAGHLANSDSAGCGIPNRKLIGKRTVYTRKDAVAWLMGLEKSLGKKAV